MTERNVLTTDKLIKRFAIGGGAIPVLGWLLSLPYNWIGHGTPLIAQGEFNNLPLVLATLPCLWIWSWLGDLHSGWLRDHRYVVLVLHTLACVVLYALVGALVGLGVKWLKRRGHNALLSLLAGTLALAVGGCSKQEVRGGFIVKSADELNVVREELNALGIRGVSHYDGEGLRDGRHFAIDGFAHGGEYAGLPVEVCLETWHPWTSTGEPAERSVRIRVSSRWKSKAENAVRHLEEHLRQRIKEKS